ncbi:conserved hypothetical protein [Theileria orientalis strain Shintoku]|uniref:Uncharacterized protein n=1 Tax=Theileria orientalis strain Shintoku TaxID=869250 RepID=J4D819_THEOR|nr:conserved hypothetical protein [Theileria orientalis strain Shintoku]BAM40510.1 conserved hypothetical protein [Theileria orientalis strain Shintoku]|eukprot:XP_009690811.1 conserved hypothetical protein [Theileria orientalis strain Shintoku]
MDSSTKHLLDQLINKVEHNHNNEAVTDELQEILKGSLSELTFKNICHPHINPEDHITLNSLNEKSDKKKRKKKETPKERELINGKEDIKNLLYSHFPKYLNSTFRFKIGELAYLKWHDELCLVIVNYASQKLLVSSDNDFDENSENDQDKNGPMAQMERRNVWLYDINEDLFLDSDNHNLYSKVNQIKPINLQVTDYNYSFSPVTSLNAKDKSVLRYYFIPMYYVCFPGYKKRCSKVFRFWVQEKDLIKFKSIKFATSGSVSTKSNTINTKESKESKDSKDKQLKEYDVCENSADEKGEKKEEKSEEQTKKGEISVIKVKVKGDKQWNKRTITNVNEYVYDVIHNIYNRDLISGKYITNADFFSNATPWAVPMKIKKIVVKEHKKVISNCINVKLKFKYRKSIFCLIQNFKYLLLIIAKYNNLSTFGGSDGKAKEDADRKNDPKAAEKDAKCPLSQMKIPSLASLRFLETCASGGSARFTDNYLNNFYWLDLLLEWIDAHFMNSCCYSRWEYGQINSVRKLYNKPLTRLLCKFFCFEYLCRVLSFDVFYVNFLSRIKKNDRLYTSYLPIIQLLLYYMAFVADEYTNSGLYGIKTEMFQMCTGFGAICKAVDTADHIFGYSSRKIEKHLTD